MTGTGHHLAELNVGRLTAPTDDPRAHARPAGSGGMRLAGALATGLAAMVLAACVATAVGDAQGLSFGGRELTVRRVAADAIPLGPDPAGGPQLGAPVVLQETVRIGGAGGDKRLAVDALIDWCDLDEDQRGRWLEAAVYYDRRTDEFAFERPC